MHAYHNLSAEESKAKIDGYKSGDLPSHQKERLQNLLEKNGDLFVKDIKDFGSGTTLVEHVIEAGDAAPVRQRAYRETQPDKILIQEAVLEMLDGALAPLGPPQLYWWKRRRS